MTEADIAYKLKGIMINGTNGTDAGSDLSGKERDRIKKRRYCSIEI